MTEEEARAKRDSLLASCDYHVMPDYPCTENNRSLWRRYRQQLRDVSDQAGFPLEITWPEEPDNSAQDNLAGSTETEGSNGNM